MDVLVVESPAKAKTIGKYLGPGFTVLASYGHVRDLPSKDGSVRPDEDFAMDWEIDPQSQKRLDAIAQAITKGGRLYLATDPDREGEAISWHVKEILGRKKALDGVDVKRVTFNSITKQSVLDAVAHPRELDQPLIDAYMARRALDYLVGFNLSPVLWRKLPGSRSAGRVQSVALRLICEREAEIEVFKSREYWTVDAVFGTAKKQALKARLTHLDGRKLDKFDLDNEERAQSARREIERRDVVPEQHFTEPPPRYSEASLVKKLEELGIGRPSTYASIIEVLQRRNYVRIDRKRFVPEDRGRIVTAFLQSYFPRYVEYDFTAHLEEELDDISGGKIDWRQVLREFWKAFSAAVGETKELRVREVLDKIDSELGPHFFPEAKDGKNPRDCPSCGEGRLGLKLGKFGAFIGCSKYPECRFTRKLGIVDAEADAASGANLDGPKILGDDPATGKQVTLRKGPYGLYVQLGEPEGKEKPKRQSLLKDMTPDDVTLEKALALLALPRELGPHPEDSEMILAGVGRFGPYVKHGPKYKSIPADESVLEIGMNRAVALLAEARVPGRGRAAVKPLRVVGNHPNDEAPIELYDGRYGHYVKHGGINATVPKDIKPEELTLDHAVSLLAERAAKGGGKKPARPKKAAAPKAKPKTKAKAANGTTDVMVPADDAAPKAKPIAKKKAAPKRKAKVESPPRTGTDG